MELSADDVDRHAAAYRESEPLYPVERDAIETLPKAFRTGEYGRRDAEWVVRWYFRRHLGGYPDAERRAIEERFENAEFEAVRSAIAAAVDADDHRAGLAALTALPGVDARVGSAFLQFVDPDRYLVVGDREWEVVREWEARERNAVREREGVRDRDVDRDPAGLGGAYPDAPTVDDYGRYLDAVRSLRDRTDRHLWDVYMAIRRVGTRDRRR